MAVTRRTGGNARRSPRRELALAVAIAGCLLASPTPAGAQPSATTATALTYYVSGAGDDANDGRSASRSLRTLQHAADLTGPGDTVLVMNGVYSDAAPSSNILTVRRSGAAGAWITYRAYPGHTPRLESRNWQAVSVQASYVVVEGLTVHGNSDSIGLAYALAQKDNLNNPLTSGNCIGVTPLYGTTRRPHHVVVRRNRVSRCPGSGIYTVNADYVTIEDNLVSGNANYSPYAGSGISTYQNWSSDAARGYKMIVRRNVSWGNYNYVPFYASDPDPARRTVTDGNGIIVDDLRNTQNNSRLGVYKGRTLVENNVVYSNGGRGINVYSSDHVDVINNTAYHNSMHPDVKDGELAVVDANDVRAYNNIVLPRPDRPATRLYQSTRTAVDYNLAFGGTSFTGTGSHNIVGLDPRFVDAGARDFALDPTSPAVDTGELAVAPPRDILGVPRPQGGGMDMGAYEAVGCRGAALDGPGAARPRVSPRHPHRDLQV